MQAASARSHALESQLVPTGRRMWMWIGACRPAAHICPRILNNRLRAQPWKIKYPVVHRRRPKLSTPSRPPSPQRLHISNFLPLGLGYTLFPRAFLFSNNSLIASSIGGLRCLPSICFPREFMVSQISGNYRFQALCQWAFNRRSAITRALITLDSQYPIPPIHKRKEEE